MYDDGTFYKLYYRQFLFTNNLLPKHEVYVDGLNLNKLYNLIGKME